MVLSRDLVAKGGSLLLCRSHKLNENVIKELRNYGNSKGYKLMIYVWLKP